MSIAKSVVLGGLAVGLCFVSACATKPRAASGTGGAPGFASYTNMIPSAGPMPGAAGSLGVLGGTGSGGAMNGLGGASSAGPSGTGGVPAPSANTGGPTAGMPMGASGASPSMGEGGTNGGSGGQPGMPQSCPTTPLQPGETNDTLMVGGQQRSYILHVPTGYTGKTPVPLVTDWHPILTDASFERGNSGYSAKADQEGFIVVWPQGIDNAWNVGPCCTTSRTVDDVGFARALIAKLEGQACIDPKRIYAVGYSMGGGMTYKLACDAADIIAAGAPAAFQLMDDTEWPCMPSRPITIISFNGANDPIVPYAGGASNPPNGLPITVHFKGAMGTFEKWASLDGCTGSPMASGFGTGCQTYNQCMGGAEVTLCTNATGGHDTGDPNVAWDMLKKHPLP